MAYDKSTLFTEAREEMGIYVSEAIHRNASTFDGNYYNFRWGRDNILYHYNEFWTFYGSNTDLEWYRAVPLLNWDGSFFIPKALFIFLICRFVNLTLGSRGLRHSELLL